MAKIRLDQFLVENRFAQSRNIAQRLVMAGEVWVNGQIVLKSSALVETESHVWLEELPRFVSRGGEKLEAAFQTFPISCSDMICVDIGASTGGFTDCLLQHGARRVYAIDVGYGILSWKIRNDNRVIVMEKTNARYLEKLPEIVDWIVIDVSFISLKKLFPVIKNWYQLSEIEVYGKPYQLLVLIKPQFEAGKKEVSRTKGIIRDPEIHKRVIIDVLSNAFSLGFSFHGAVKSPIVGQKGNVEFIAWLEYPGDFRDNLEEITEKLIFDRI